MRVILLFEVLFTLIYLKSSYATSCDDKKQWTSSPGFDVDGYLDLSLEKMLGFIRLLKHNKIKGKLKIHQCIAISLFAEAYRLRGEPCSKSRWFDSDAYGFATCHILGITALMNFTPLSFDILLSKHPECIIRTVEEFRKKVTKEDIKKAILFIENPDFTVEPNAIDKIPDCEEIRNPGFWTKVLKWPKGCLESKDLYILEEKVCP